MPTHTSTSDKDRNSLPGPSSSIQEFCARHHISKSLFHTLARTGRGPKIMRLGRAFRISAAAEQQWLAARENPSSAEQRLIEREHKALAERSRKGGKAAFQSEKHPTRKRMAAIAAAKAKR